MTEDAPNETVKPRHRQLDADGDRTQTLLNSLTLDYIRQATYNLDSSKKIPIRTHADAFEALLRTGKSTEKIQKSLLDIEQAYPFKHCLILRLDAQGRTPESDQTYSHGNVKFTLSHITAKPIFSLTFEHEVQFKEWVEVAPDMRRRRTVVTRQPIVLRAHPDRNLLTLSYPGYTHSGESTAGSYEEIIASLLHILAEGRFGWKLSTLPIKEALKYLLDGTNKRVTQVKADVDTPLARLDVSAKGEGQNIEEALASFISEHLPEVNREALITASKKAFLNAVPNSIVLYWLKESLFTRLRFWENGTELLFVWNKEPASYHLVDEITYTLSETSGVANSGNDLTQEAFKWILSCKSKSVITPGDLASRFPLQPDKARSTLLIAMRAGIVEPVYRVATTAMIEELPNHWTNVLSCFKKILTTVDGQKIDGTNPENIEVAFQRISSETE